VTLKVNDSDLSASGPYPALRSRVLVFSQGNDFEWHGPALPADIDSRFARTMALRFSERTGATFAAHIPFTSDRVGEIARDWSPAYLPFEEFKEKLISFVGKIVHAWPVKPFRVFILMGHGGVIPFLKDVSDVQEETGIETQAFFLPALGVKEVKLPKDFEGTTTLREILDGQGEHAYIMEHSIAAYLGFLDRKKFDDLNRAAKENPEEVLKKWPALAGLGGYVKFGGERYDILYQEIGTFCVEDFIKRRKIPISNEAGKALVEAELSELERIALKNFGL